MDYFSFNVVSNCLLALTLPDITFREPFASSVLSCEVAVVAEGTELAFVNTMVESTTTDPFLR